MLNRWRLEKSVQRKILAERLLDTREQTHGEQRVSTQVKEVVFDPDGTLA